MYNCKKILGELYALKILEKCLKITLTKSYGQTEKPAIAEPSVQYIFSYLGEPQICFFSVNRTSLLSIPVCIMSLLNNFFFVGGGEVSRG